MIWLKFFEELYFIDLVLNVRCIWLFIVIVYGDVDVLVFIYLSVRFVLLIWENGVQYEMIIVVGEFYMFLGKMEKGFVMWEVQL